MGCAPVLANPQAAKDLPLVEMPAVESKRDLFAVVISGDGGWASIDKHIAAALHDQGIPVVGLNSLRYFWRRRTPEETAADVARIIEAYAKEWNKTFVVLVGYSRGADVLPFVINRLPPDSRSKVVMAVFLTLEPTIDFEIHAGDIFNFNSSRAQPVKPELDQYTGIPGLCFYGKDELDSLCRGLKIPNVEVIEMKGGHHFGGEYQRLGKLILERLPPAQGGSPK
jgi:type IV secretory pathway VirJ component